jgi:hypothetical protein
LLAPATLAAAGVSGRMEETNKGVINSLNKAADILSQDGTAAEARKVMTRSRLGFGENKALNFFIEKMPKMMLFKNNF